MSKQKISLVGPMFLSVLSFFLSVFFIQLILKFFESPISLLATGSGIGKIILITLAIVHILLLIPTQSQKFINQWKTTNILFILKRNWLSPFFFMFIIFFLIHGAIIAFALGGGQINYNPQWADTLKLSIIWNITFGFFATFLLAWHEELIFRGTLFAYFAQTINPLVSILITSFIFMITHNLGSPLILITEQWQLGFGLFLLGILLNLAFIISQTLHIPMGIHAGLVFVKVILRRIPLFHHLPSEQWAWWFNQDLRKSPLVHGLFIIIILVLVFLYRKKLNLATQHETV